jgi:hypothetical protein
LIKKWFQVELTFYQLLQNRDLSSQSGKDAKEVMIENLEKIIMVVQQDIL